MPISRRRLFSVGLAVAGGALAGCSSGARGGNESGAQVEVFTWWSGPGEKEGLDALVADFKAKNPGIDFNNAAVAGGAGSNARAILADRLKADNPPDSYQVHAGLELQSDVRAGKCEDLTALYEQQGWKDNLPKSLLDAITLDGKIYSVPVDVHRANLLWYSPKIVAAAGIASPPKTWDEFLVQAEALKAKGLTALSIGPGWTQKHLLETVLLGQLGPDKYLGLWNGRTDWNGPDVLAALGIFTKVLGYSDIASAAGDWQPAIDKIISGAAVYNVMGDWVVAYLSTSKQLVYKTDYAVTTSPGSVGIYDFLSDSFTLPKGAPHRTAAEKWLMECGSTEGQDLFNPRKGSVPARLDSDRALYHGYIAEAIAAWLDTDTTVVGSLTHGVVANTVWSAAIDTALAAFVHSHDAPAFAAAVASSYQSSR
jgi:glucose/mannose transport system substrate-binding protein